MIDEYGLSRIILRALRTAGKLSMSELQARCECNRVDLVRTLEQIHKRGYEIHKEIDAGFMMVSLIN